MKCDCKRLDGHDEWCDAHPINQTQEELESVKRSMQSKYDALEFEYNDLRNTARELDHTRMLLQAELREVKARLTKEPWCSLDEYMNLKDAHIYNGKMILDLEAKLKIAEDAIEAIQEYWNKDYNDEAMQNALDFTMDKCFETLSKLREGGKS